MGEGYKKTTIFITRMASKRPGHPDFISNPFIKKCNLEWTLQTPEDGKGALESITSSPLGHFGINRTSGLESDHNSVPADNAVNEEMPGPTISAAIEAGTMKVDHHASCFAEILGRANLSPYPAKTPRLQVSEYRELYETNFGSRHGAHFVIHQHDHPLAGPHYDLRLQINEESSASWALMYGLPGDPNSTRLNRNATETRVHCLWVSQALA
jgi:hypothetical protein